MPDYANLRERAYEHAGRIGSPVRPTLNQPEGTYTIYPQGIDWPVYQETYYPTETAGQPDLFASGFFMRPEEVSFVGQGIEDLPRQDYELGRLTIKRQYSDDVKIADGYPQGSPQYIALHEEARMAMQSRLSKLQMNLDRTEMTFKQIRQNPNFSQEEQFESKAKYYKANPVWEAPEVKYPREEKLSPREALVRQLMTEVRPVITPEGAPVTVPPTGERIVGRRPAIEEPTERPARVTPPAMLPPKPIGFPDAIWNERYKAWTVIRNGQINILKKKGGV